MLDMIETEFRQNLKMHPTMKSTFLNLAQTLILDNVPYNEWSDKSKMRCYFWDTLVDH